MANGHIYPILQGLFANYVNLRPVRIQSRKDHKIQEKSVLSLSETCPGATETLLFVDSMYPATVLAIWLEKHLRKLLRRASDPNS